jgi:carboxymethylenebutenolidase
MEKSNELVACSVYVDAADQNAGLNGYLVRPARPGVYPGVIVCMEIFGVTGHMREVAGRIAEQGYIVMVPNYYWRHCPEADFPHDAQGREEGMAFMRQLQREQVLQDAASARSYLLRREDCNGKVGIVGFSIGGHIAYLAATQLNFEVAVSFYGGWIVRGGIRLSTPEPTALLTAGMARSGTRFLGFVGGRDHLIGADEWEELEQILTDHGVHHELVVYPEAKHGFFCDSRPDSYDPEAARDAWTRLVGLLDEGLTRGISRSS